MKDFRLLFHHHALVYQEGKQICVPSFIGRWVNALVPLVGEIGLLMYETNTRLAVQDEYIQGENVRLWSLGAPGKTWDRLERIARLRKVCFDASKQADGLLIRGGTPRQLDVWRATPLQNKAYLLVGSLVETKPEWNLSFWGMYRLFMTYWRRQEVMNIAQSALLMANSPALVDEFESLGKKAEFVPTNSIRLSEFSSLSFRSLSDPIRLLFCGRVVPEKGIRELIHALAQLSTTAAYELDIVGSVDAEFWNECEQLAQNLNVTEYIRWHGRIPYGENLFAFYRQADVFVLPTYFEGFPHVIWEAAANCCPIVTTHVGGIPAIFKHEVHGLLVPSKNSDALCSSIQRICSDFEIRRNLIQEAYQLALNFSVESCAQILVETLAQKWNDENKFLA